MKNISVSILKEYLLLFPEEEKRQKKLIEFLHTHEDNDITNWNNFDGHVVGSGFIYAKEETSFLVLYHKDLKMYLYPGGHADKNDRNPIEISIREIKEETGLSELKQVKLDNDGLIPIDIDTHIIEYNERLNLPEHYHFDFRYLFIIDKIEDIKIDDEELTDYQWIDINELSNDANYGKIVEKIKKVMII